MCSIAVLCAPNLKSKALFPVKWEKAAAHAPLKIVDNGKLDVGEQVGYHIRTGAYGITGSDWQHYYDFADKVFKVKK